MAKINRTRSIDSLQPDRRDGHKPAVTTQFWGDKSCGNRHSEKGPGKKVEVVGLPGIKPWWEMVIPDPDPVTLKDYKPKIKYQPPQPKKVSLDDLVNQFNQRRSR